MVFLELLLDTTIHPEVDLESLDLSTVTLSRPKSAFSNCCACPGPEDELKTTTEDISKKAIMKDRGGKELQETDTENEIETTTLLTKGISESSTTSKSSEESTSDVDDDNDSSGCKGKIG